MKYIYIYQLINVVSINKNQINSLIFKVAVSNTVISLPSTTCLDRSLLVNQI